MTTEATLRIVIELPERTIDLLERLVVVMEEEYDRKYGYEDVPNDED